METALLITWCALGARLADAWGHFFMPVNLACLNASLRLFNRTFMFAFDFARQMATHGCPVGQDDLKDKLMQNCFLFSSLVSRFYTPYLTLHTLFLIP